MCKYDKHRRQDRWLSKGRKVRQSVIEYGTFNTVEARWNVKFVFEFTFV